MCQILIVCWLISLSRLLCIETDFHHNLEFDKTPQFIRRKSVQLVNEGDSEGLIEFLVQVEVQFGDLRLDDELPSLYNYKGVVALFETT